MAENNNIDSIEGVVLEALPNTLFRVQLEDGREVLSYVSGKMRMHRIRILVGDKVKIEIPSEGESRGRIVYRFK